MEEQMQYLFQLGLGIVIGGVIVTFIAGMLKDLRRTSYGLGLMALGATMMMIYLKEYTAQWIFTASVLAIGYLVVMAGYKYSKSRK